MVSSLDKNNEPKNNETETRTYEKGIFERTKIRRGKKTQTHTEIIKRNPKKVVLCRFKNIEFYAYPFDYPKDVFFGVDLAVHESAIVSDFLKCQIRGTEWREWFRIQGILKWYINGNWKLTEQETKRKQPKHLKTLKEHILLAYNSGLSELKELENSSPDTN